MLCLLSYRFDVWSGQQDLNLRQLRSKRRTLARLSYTQDVWKSGRELNSHFEVESLAA